MAPTIDICNTQTQLSRRIGEKSSRSLKQSRGVKGKTDTMKCEYEMNKAKLARCVPKQ